MNTVAERRHQKQMIWPQHGLVINMWLSGSEFSLEQVLILMLAWEWFFSEACLSPRLSLHHEILTAELKDVLHRRMRASSTAGGPEQEQSEHVGTLQAETSILSYICLQPEESPPADHRKELRFKACLHCLLFLDQLPASCYDTQSMAVNLPLTVCSMLLSSIP